MIVALPDLVNTGLVAAGRRDELTALATRSVRECGADVVVFPELSACGYPEHGDAAADRALLDAVSEPLDGPTGTRFVELARELGCALVFGFSELEGDRRFNTLAWADPSGALVGYRKIHLTPAESLLWQPGQRAVVGDTSPCGPVGLSSCYDRMFPDIFARQRELGARVSVISSAWSSFAGVPAVLGDDGRDLWAEHAEALDRARAIETGMVVVSTNYSGPKVPGSSALFCGGRRVIDGLGRALRPTVWGEIAVWDVDLAASDAAVRMLNDGDFFSRDRRVVR